jgi:phosphoribosylamine--glycine ligase
MGTAMFWTGSNRLYRETIEKMKKKLADAGYVGYFDINCIATARTIYPLEVTPRFGYPTVSIQMEGLASLWGEFLYALGSKKPYTLRTQKGFQVGVVIALPPWPFADLDTFRKFSEDAVVIFTKPGMDGVHLGDVKLEEGDWKITGHDGYALVITGSGLTMEEAHREAYTRVKTIIIPNMFYRTDIGFRWRHEGDLLHTWGLLT